jgi:serine/threonine protein phosphatase PrpC
MQAKAGQKELRKILDDNAKNNNANLYEGECIAGSTANVVLLTKEYIYCANAGDSRAIAILK